MKLYYSPGACSLSPHIVLNETGQKFEIEQVDLGTKKTKSGADFLKINPKGYVPALVLDSGEVLTEGPAIVQYLADQKPGSGLAPENGTLARYKLQEWLNFITSEMHKSMGALFSKELDDKGKDVMRGLVARRLAYLDQHLAKNDYVMGKDFTVADAYLFTVLGWGQYVGVDIGKYANVSAYAARIGARPKVAATLKAEGLA
ncbi:MAG: glutathione transferase GstA [Hyphomicrobiaceae bacterium]